MYLIDYFILFIGIFIYLTQLKNSLLVCLIELNLKKGRLWLGGLFYCFSSKALNANEASQCSPS